MGAGELPPLSPPNEPCCPKTLDAVLPRDVFFDAEDNEENAFDEVLEIAAVLGAGAAAAEGGLVLEDQGTDPSALSPFPTAADAPVTLEPGPLEFGAVVLVAHGSWNAEKFWAVVGAAAGGKELVVVVVGVKVLSNCIPDEGGLLCPAAVVVVVVADWTTGVFAEERLNVGVQFEWGRSDSNVEDDGGFVAGAGVRVVVIAGDDGFSAVTSGGGGFLRGMVKEVG